jgi:ATP-dependent helicase HrpB
MHVGADHGKQSAESLGHPHRTCPHSCFRLLSDPTTPPIEPTLPAIRAALRDATALVLQAPPGTGKTTRVPLALLDEPWLKTFHHPATGTATTSGARGSGAHGRPTQRAGQTHRRLPYPLRPPNLAPNSHRSVLTEGILTRRLQRDPALEGVRLVIFDEFHERSLHADLALTLCLDSQREFAPEDLRLLVMSATLEGVAVARLLGDAPIVTSEGRAHPVNRHYLPRDPDGLDLNVVAHAVLNALSRERGDLLVFLPGGGEIRQVLNRLQAEPACAELTLAPLYGDLPGEAQQRAIRRDPDWPAQSRAGHPHRRNQPDH